MTILKIHAETHELPRMSDVSALLEVRSRLQTSSERIERSNVIIVRAVDRVEQSAERLLRSHSICTEVRLSASTPESN